MSRSVRTAGAGMLLLSVLAACNETGAAEPGEAPPLEVPPAGTVVELAGQAEGLVADPVTHVVAVGTREPTGLLLVDGRTGEQVARVPVENRLRHLQLAAPGGPVLLPAEDAGTFLTVELPSGEVSAEVPIGTYAHDATALPDGTIATADEQAGALVVVRDGDVVHRFTDLTQPGGVAATGDLVAVIDVDQHTLSLYDPAQPARLGRVGAGDGPTHIVTDRRGRLIVTDTRGDRVLAFTATPEQVGEVALAGSPYGITYDRQRDRVWVTLTERNEVVGLDGETLREVARLPTVRQPNTVAVDSDTGRVFVASRTDGTLQLIDP